MDTAPLPAVPADQPPHRELAGLARGIEVVAGLVSAGLVALGLILVALQIISPELAPGSGLATAVGPTWLRALAQLGVGVAGEIAVWARPRMSRGPRVWVAIAVLVAVGAVLWMCWWR